MKYRSYFPGDVIKLNDFNDTFLVISTLKCVPSISTSRGVVEHLHTVLSLTSGELDFDLAFFDIDELLFHIE